MRKVYVLVDFQDYEPSRNIGVFSTPEIAIIEANKFLDKYHPKSKRFEKVTDSIDRNLGQIEIEEHVLDEGVELTAETPDRIFTGIFECDERS